MGDHMTMGMQMAVQAQTWGLLIATKDRLEALRICVSLALSQKGGPPCEVVIVDASAEWKAHRDEIAALLAPWPDVRFVYLEANTPSLTVQRNQAIAEGRADILFMIDDDSFMHPGCAAEIMALYQADTEGVLAGVQAAESPINPAQGQGGARQEGKPLTEARRSKSAIGRWLIERVMMRSMRGVFVPYRKGYPKTVIPADIDLDRVAPAVMFSGFAMTYRAEVIRRTGFAGCLRYYCPGEDLDASYRASDHGALIIAKRALLHHYASASGRIDRRKVAHLWSLNQAVLLRLNAEDQSWARGAWTRKMLHRLATDVIKDLGRRRISLPQTRGSWRAFVDGRRVWGRSVAEIEAWYPGRQTEILKG